MRRVRFWVTLGLVLTVRLGLAEDTSAPKVVAGCRRPLPLVGGKRIVSEFGIVEFRVPRMARVEKGADVDYVQYVVRYGDSQQKQRLRFMFGAMVVGGSPVSGADSTVRWKGRAWTCGKLSDGGDSRGVGADGRRWRHISFPFGFAEYRGVGEQAARYFDRILDTLCCGACAVCSK